MTFDQFLRSLGLRPQGIAPDEKVRRCYTDDKPRGKKNGAYWLSVSGERGWGRDWAVHTEPVHWRAEKQDQGISRAELDRMRRRNEKLQTERRREREQEQERASAAARAYYRKCKPLYESHPYLEAHRLSVASGFRVDDDGWLVVPAFRRTPRGNYTVSTIQRISPEGKKLFWKDAPAEGVSYAISRQHAGLTVLCEGLATGLALYAALSESPSARILVAFTANNLYHRDVVKRVPDGPVVVAADNDHETEAKGKGNPGVICAGRAAVLLGCGVAVPECVTGTDWADFRDERFLWYKERLHAYGRDFMAWQQADADIRRRVIPEASMNRLPEMVAS